MRLFALLLKEAQQHTGAVIGSSILLGMLWLAGLSFAMTMESGTLLTVASGFAYYGMPLAIGFILRRLVVLEHEQHTHDFLAALPVSAWMLSGVKYVLGLMYTMGIALFAVLFTALLVSRQELISARFLLQVIAQIGCYLFAWYGLTWMAAHIGRYRFTFWMLLIAFMFTAGELYPDAWTELLWHAALGEKLDVTRVATPWASMAISLAYGAVGTAVGFFLATWQQGSVAASWYGPMSTHEKTGLVLVIVISWLSVDVIESLVEMGGPSYERLPDVADGPSVVRVAGGEAAALHPLGVELGASIDGLVAAIGEGEVPTVVLVPVQQEAEELVNVRSNDHGELVLEVDLSATRRQLLRRCLSRVIAYRSAGMPAMRADRAWIVDGAPRWWTGADPEHPDVYAKRAAVAVHAGLMEEDLVDSLALRLRFGPDVARAVGWAGLSAVEELAGREAVEALLAETLPPQSLPNVFAALRTDWRSGETRFVSATGLDPATHRTAWFARLQAHYVTHRHAAWHAVPQWGKLERKATDEADVTLVSTWEAALPDGAMVRWWTLDPLHSAPLASADDRWKSRDLERGHERIATPVDARRRVAVTFAVPVAALQGEVWSGAVVDP